VSPLTSNERAARIAAAERELAELRAWAAEIERRWERLLAMASEIRPAIRCTLRAENSHESLGSEANGA
jgi:hypothetical protein